MRGGQGRFPKCAQLDRGEMQLRQIYKLMYKEIIRYRTTIISKVLKYSIRLENYS
jgi:hypothetical protein